MSGTVGQGPSYPGLELVVRVEVLWVAEDLSAGQIDHAGIAQERRAERDVLAPHAVDRLGSFVGQALVYLQDRRAAGQGERLLEVERRSVSPYREPHAYPLRRILKDHRVPGHQVDLGVETHVGQAVNGREPSAGQHGLPSALVVVQPYVGRRSGSRSEPARVADSPWGAPHEVDIGGLVDKLVDVGALVDQDDDSEYLVLDDGRLQSAERPSRRKRGRRRCVRVGSASVGLLFRGNHTSVGRSFPGSRSDSRATFCRRFIR